MITESIKLPAPVRFTDAITSEIRKPDTKTLLGLYDSTQEGKTYSALTGLMRGGVISIGDNDNPQLSELRGLPLPSAEVLAMEMFSMYGVETKLEGVYQCPRNGCGSRIIHEQTRDEDTRDDIGELSIRYSSDDGKITYDSCNYVHSIEDPEHQIVLQWQGRDVMRLDRWEFRIPTLGDLEKLQNDTTIRSDTRRAQKLFYDCLVGISGDYDGELDIGDDPKDVVEFLKKKYNYAIIEFPDYRDFDAIIRSLRLYGLNLFIEMGCPNCGKVWNQTVDWTGFFESGLRSLSDGKAGSHTGRK